MTTATNTDWPARAVRNVFDGTGFSFEFRVLGVFTSNSYVWYGICAKKAAKTEGAATNPCRCLRMAKPLQERQPKAQLEWPTATGRLGWQSAETSTENRRQLRNGFAQSNLGRNQAASNAEGNEKPEAETRIPTATFRYRPASQPSGTQATCLAPSSLCAAHQQKQSTDSWA